MRVLFKEMISPFESIICLGARTRVVRTNKREFPFDGTAAVGTASAVGAAGFAGTVPTAVVVTQAASACVTGTRTRPSGPWRLAFAACAAFATDMLKIPLARASAGVLYNVIT